MQTSPSYRRQVLTVDSRSRMNADMTTPASYKMTFPTFFNVKMVRLISTEVPNTEYVIHARNNLLYLYDTPTLTEHTVVLAPGTYTATELANEANLKLNAAVGAGFGAIFQVTAMTMTSKIRIDRVDHNQWGLRFAGKTNTAALVMGFDPASDAIVQLDAPNWYTESVTVMNLAGENYVYLCVKGMPTVVTSERLHDVFAKIIYNVPPRSIAFDSFISNAYIYPEPVNISQLEISFMRHDGFLVDFNDVEHSFSIEIFTTS